MKTRDFLAISLLLGATGIAYGASADDDDPFGLAEFNDEVDALLLTQAAESAVIGAEIAEASAAAGAVAEVLDPVEQEKLNGELFDAVQKGNREWVKDLIARGANVIARGEYNSIPLHHAYNSPEIMEILIKADSGSVNFKDAFGQTPLNLVVMNVAVMNVSVRCGLSGLRKLLDAGADVEIMANDGSTALHNAVNVLNGEILSTLLAYAPEAVDVKYGKTGDTPLMWAVCHNKNPILSHIAVGLSDKKESLIKALVDAGADPDIPNELGKTPRQVARALGCEYLLPERGAKTKPVVLRK